MIIALSKDTIYSKVRNNIQICEIILNHYKFSIEYDFNKHCLNYENLKDYFALEDHKKGSDSNLSNRSQILKDIVEPIDDEWIPNWDSEVIELWDKLIDLREYALKRFGSNSDQLEKADETIC